MLTESNFVVKIDSFNGHALDSIALNETGSYIREGANAGVAATGTLSATNLNAVPLTSVSNIMPTVPFSETVFSNPPGLWAAKANLIFSPDTSSVLINIDSILRAKIFKGADGSETVFIGQNFVGLTVTTIPLPLAVWLFGSGLLGMLSISKRRKFI